jgi:predicted ATPase/class 3 adenylate cyclase
MREVGAGLPSGLLTFVFTDIEGSTALLRELGDGFAAVLERHNALLREVWSAHNGYEVQFQGDGFFVVFENTIDAVSACIDAQQRLLVERWPFERHIRVRMGVHAGLAAPLDSGYPALAAHQAARVVAAAEGGQILVSDVVVARCEARSGLELRRLGRFHLRDFDGPAELFQVTFGGAAPVARVRARPADRHNFIAPTASFVGRDDELASLATLIGSGALVTVVGPGGVGKTRVAVELALRIADDWTDGVWMVELAQLQDGALVASAVADAVGARIPAGTDTRQAVLDHLYGRAALLIFDNCEHLIDECADLVMTLLAACPSLGLLATSREPLGLADERPWRLTPLSTDASPDDLVSPAVRLFVDRAGSEPESIETISEICQRLDGLPLAIELAAARASTVPPARLLSALDTGLRLLQSRTRGGTPHHRALTATLDWSYELLSSEEQRVLRRLGAFAGTFTAAAVAAAVAGADADAVEETLWSLVDKSLVEVDVASGGDRYGLLETVRSYTRDQLDRAGETPLVVAGLAEWYAQRLSPTRAGERTWMEEMRLDLPNVRRLVALLAASRPDATIQLLSAMALFHDYVGSYNEGIRELRDYAARFAATDARRAPLLADLGFLQMQTGDLGGSRESLTEARTLAAEPGAVPEWAEGKVPWLDANLLAQAGAAEQAIVQLRDDLAATQSPRARALIFGALGTAYTSLSRYDEAATVYETQCELYHELGRDVVRAIALGNLAECYARTGNLLAAARREREALELAVRLGLQIDVGMGLNVTAHLCASIGDWSTATMLLARCRLVYEECKYSQNSWDRDVDDVMLERARAALGDTAFFQCLASVSSLDLVGAVDLAATVLRKIDAADLDFVGSVFPRATSVRRVSHHDGGGTSCGRS